MKNRNLVCCAFLAVFLLALSLGCALPAAAAVPTALEKGKAVLAFPYKSGKITVYKDSACKEKEDTVKGKSLLLTIKKKEGSAFYCEYKKGKKTVGSWFKQNAILGKASYDKLDAMLRYTVPTYARPSGKYIYKIPAYTDVDIVGKAGKWYQITYKYKGKYRMTWLKKSDYEEAIRIFDGTEKKQMAEGRYSMSTGSSYSKMAAVQNGSLVMTAAVKKPKSNQIFSFSFAGKNCYQIQPSGSKLCLTAERDEEGSYTGKVVLAEKDKEQEAGQLWELIRSGRFYFLKNKGTKKYLTSGKSFKTAGKKSGSSQKFRITMTGGKNTKHWQVFSQYDSDWGSKKYGKTNTMAASACGVLSSVNAVYYLNGQFIDPMELASYAVKTKYRIEGSGTLYTFVKAAAKKFGKKYGYKYVGSTTKLSTLKKHLKNGGTAVAYVPHHYMAVGDYKNGKYLALDSYATKARKTSPFGCWINGKRFLSGSLYAKMFLLLSATK